MSSGVQVLDSGSAKWTEEPSDEGRTLLVLNLPRSTDDMLEDVAARMHCDKGRALDLAIALMKLSLDAKENGMRVGAVDAGKELDAEFKGF